MDEEKKVNSGIEYKNKKWRPSVFINKDKQKAIETLISEKGFKTFNEYINDLIDKDMGIK